MDDEHLDGDAPNAHVIVDGQKPETCGNEANILKTSRILRVATVQHIADHRIQGHTYERSQ